MKIQCEWCQKNEAEFELAVYFLREVTTYKRSQHVDAPTMMEYKTIGKGDLYASVKICGNCLPLTKQTVKEAKIENGRQK